MADFWVAGFVSMIRLRQGKSLAQRALRKAGLMKARDGRAGSMPRSIPKKIWLYWDSGEASAPPLVRACIDSWRQKNPDWDVQVLDATSAPQTVELPFTPADVPVQSYADLLRLRLLSTHGGVWADATLWCVTPLDHWLPVVAQRGFFAFVWTRTDAWVIWPNMRREVTNWFLAAQAGGAVISGWDAKSEDYWSKGRRKPHVYYWPHMLFDWLRLSDRKFRRAVNEMPRLGCFAPHLVHDHVHSDQQDPAEIRRLLASGAAPVQKLRWNWSDAQLERAAEVLDGLEAPDVSGAG